jgi:hypothetical protein
MPVSYCRQHERLWSRKSHTWIDFSFGKIEAIAALYRFFSRSHIDTSEYLVVETPCDKCEDTVLHIVPDKLKKVDPP